MSFSQFSDLANALNFNPHDAEKRLPWDKANLFVCPLPVVPQVPAYIATLNFNTLAKHSLAQVFEDEPRENFHFDWPYVAEGNAVSALSQTNRFFEGILPADMGQSLFCQDMSQRAELYCSATGQEAAVCQLRFSSVFLDDGIHRDFGESFTAGTSYLNLATAFIDLAHLAKVPQTNGKHSASDPELAPHLRSPQLYDLYLFNSGRDHAVPQFAGKRITLLMR